MPVVGIRREDKSVWERRTPLVPDDVRALTEQGVRIQVERSPQRCFPDAEFAAAGAELVDGLAEAQTVLGVKEVPTDKLESGKTYMYFSHTIKGQPYNMPMLQRLLDLECTLLDYELVTDDDGVRTIAFGRHAGVAGAIDTLWALGQRWQRRGVETPFSALHQALEYGELKSARLAIEAAGSALREGGLPEKCGPLVIGVTGAGGKVFGGAVEVLEYLPHRFVAPEDLAAEVRAHSGRAREALIVGYGPEHLVEPARDGVEYSFPHYLENPGDYRACFGRHLPHLTAIVHGILWAPGYPRFILKEDLAALWSGPEAPKLEVITDVTCDVGGSNEALDRTTEPGDPVYVFDPLTGEAPSGWDGRGPLIVAVDILPTEIPLDSSRHFSEQLAPMVPHLARGVPDPGDTALPGSLRSGILVHRGRIVAPYDDALRDALRQHGKGE
ncbi:MAG: hypothetical protein HKN12_11795 [Gemmatimonadetes bacterium]|nr:hypothetical protein [Gemmatimonadota bacterium]